MTTNAAQTEAAVKAAEATLEKAELDLSYTAIHAPFSGEIGKVNYDVGNVVSGQSGPLATLTAIDPIYVSFQVEEADYISYLQEHKNDKDPANVPMELTLRLPNNTQYDKKASLILLIPKLITVPVLLSYALDLPTLMALYYRVFL